MKTNNSHQIKNKKILVVVTGSIAAVKTPLLVSSLIQKGAEVKCVITPSGSKLISPQSLSTLSRNRCYQDKDQWNSAEARPLHIALAEWADLIVVAPLSATSLAKWTNGLSEGLAVSILLAAERPIVAAPAMNTGMWNNPSIQRNWQRLKEQSNIIHLEPSEGLLACDRLGDGRMASPDLIELAIESANIQIKKDLEGVNLLITTGPTIEDIDAARYISNRSSGKMGVFLAQVARFRGASVELIHGQLNFGSMLLEGLNTNKVRNAKELDIVLEKLQSSADAIVMTAAIADIRTKENHKNLKVPKKELCNSMGNKFELVPDLLSKIIKRSNPHQVFLGFSALTGSDEEIKQIAIQKKASKGCDLLMANPIDRLNQGFESEYNGGWLIGPEKSILKIPVDSKLFVAHELLDAIKSVLMVKSKNK